MIELDNCLSDMDFFVYQPQVFLEGFPKQGPIDNWLNNFIYIFPLGTHIWTPNRKSENSLSLIFLRKTRHNIRLIQSGQVRSGSYNTKCTREYIRRYIRWFWMQSGPHL